MRERHRRLRQPRRRTVCFTAGHGATLPVTWTEEVRGRGPGWRGRPSVSHQRPSAASPPPPSSAHFCRILSLGFHVATSGSLCGAAHQLLLAPVLLLPPPPPLSLSRSPRGERTHQNRPDYITHSASQIKLPWTKQSNKK